MSNQTLLIDYAWEHPRPKAIKRAGITGVMRYLSTDSSKNLTNSEAKALHAAGLGIGLVYETTANRAAGTEADGRADARDAEAQADALGFPAELPIYYAVDFDATPTQVRAYFKGIRRAAKRPVGVYGGEKIVDASPALAPYAWQTSAWSNGVVSGTANLYQRQTPTVSIKGALGGWDENVLLKDFGLWTAQHRKAAAKAAVQKAKQQVRAHKRTHRRVHKPHKAALSTWGHTLYGTALVSLGSTVLDHFHRVHFGWRACLATVVSGALAALSSYVHNNYVKPTRAARRVRKP